MYLQISMDLQMSSTLSDTQVCLEMSKKLHMWRCITTELQMFSTISLQPQVFIKYPYISLCVSPQDQICLCNSKGLSMCLQIQNPRRVYRSLQNCKCIYIAIKKLTFYCTSAELQREKVLLTVNVTTPDPLSLLLDFYALLGHLFFCLHTLSMGFN